MESTLSERVQLPAKVCRQHLATLATPTKFLELQFKSRVSELEPLRFS